MDYNNSMRNTISCGLGLVAFFVLFCGFYVSRADAYVFSRNLSVGSRGQDVAALQMLLNSSSDTVVSVSGPGSAGNETEYFGPATQAAVVKFQNKYASTILHPLGLSAGTGFVGNATRTKLNAVSSSFVIEPPEAFGIFGESSGAPATGAPLIPPGPASLVPPSDNLDNILNTALTGISPDLAQFSNILSVGQGSELQLAFLSANSGKRGSNLSLLGIGFEANNIIYFNDTPFSGVPSASGNIISFTIPQTIAPGVYDVEVGNSKGQTQTNNFFVVTADNALPPEITSVSPEKVSIGNEVTISGKNFTTTGNQVHSSIGVFSDLNSDDGKTIRFIVSAPASVPQFQQVFSGTGLEVKIFMTVVNANGVSSYSSPGSVVLK